MCQRKKILGVILRDNLKLNAHIGEIVRKANKRLFFLRLLKKCLGVKTHPYLRKYVICYNPDKSSQQPMMAHFMHGTISSSQTQHDNTRREFYHANVVVLFCSQASFLYYFLFLYKFRVLYHSKRTGNKKK